MATSSTPSSSGDAEKEEILERMLTRLALTEDSKLETILPKLLPYTISCLASDSLSMRNKVIEILTHLNKRVKYQNSIQLPLLELWNLYMELNAAPMVKNFSIVYIEMAFERVSIEEKAIMVPKVIAILSKLPTQHQDILLRIVIKVIGECYASRVDEGHCLDYKWDSDTDLSLFIEFCLLTILYQLPPTKSEGGYPFGLSIRQSERVTGKKLLQREDLLKRKLGILNVLEALDLNIQLVYPLYITASADSEEPVMKRGEELIKKNSSRANLEDPALVNKLFMLFLGTDGGETIPPDSRVNAGSLKLQVRLMSTFCRSVIAANSFPSTLKCIWGSIFGTGTNPRLKQLGMEFTVWVFKHAQQEHLKLLGPVLLSGLLNFLDGQTTIGSDAMTRDMKKFAYQAVGLLGNRMPPLFREKAEIANRLFGALQAEETSVRLTIQEALNALSTAYKGAPMPVLKQLEVLLLENSKLDQPEARLCAVRWATSLFDYQHCPSRYICIIGASDEKLDIREMALEGLLLSKDQGQISSEKYPKLNDMLEFISIQQPFVLEPTIIREQKLIFPSKTYVAMIRFLLNTFRADPAHATFDENILGSLSAFEIMCLLLEHAFAYEGSLELHVIAMKGLMAIASHVPELIASRYAARLPWLRQFLSHFDSDVRECASRLLGISCSSLSALDASGLMEELMSVVIAVDSLRHESYDGTICALGYVVAQCVTGRPQVSVSLLNDSVSILTKKVHAGSPTLAAVSMEALGHIGIRGPLPLVTFDSGPTEVLTTLSDHLRKLLGCDDIKAIQKIAISLGHIAFKETSSQTLKMASELVFSLCRSKVEDVLFAAGEALSFIFGGIPVTAEMILKSDYASLSQTSNYLTGDSYLSATASEADSETGSNEDPRVLIRNDITHKLFDELLYSSRKEERLAGTVWLLSLTTYCGHHPKIQQLLPEIQEAFSYLLGDQNELTQELASQGMSIVYQIGNPSMRRDLVNALVGTLTGSAKRKRAMKLTEDSEVSLEGAGGGSVNGGKITTYKELCNIANEVGQPELIYKLMDLANYQSSLNSKRGAAFGFSKIAKIAGEALQPHMKMLVPRLIRYQYDPDRNVQDAFGHIWKSLVAEPKRAIDEHFHDIVGDLITQCGSRLWRSREASCLALADLIQGRKFIEVSIYFKRIWVAAFRAMDDVKETVRNAGDKLCRSVSSLTIRLCDISLTEKSDAIKAMEIILPFLLSEGIVSKVANVQKTSVTMVTKLAKGAGDVIRPHLPVLVCCMLEGLSSLEDQRLNYIELHSANIGIQSDKLENMRIAVAKDSPMWETLDLCLKFVDTQALDNLVSPLVQLVRTGVGLNTRVGVATFASLIVQRVGSDIKPYTGTLSRAFFPAVLHEKSGSAKRAFAAACANLLKYANSSQTQELIEKTVVLHNGDRNDQLCCAILLKHYSHQASNVTSGYYSEILPVVFLSRFGDDIDVSNLFEELWEETSTSESVTLQLYLSEIVTLICNCMASSAWSEKKKSAKAISKLSEVMGEVLSTFQHELLTCLLQELSGRLWEGKESILLAIAALCSSCHKAISSKDSTMPSVIVSSIVTACKKKVKSYRNAAFSCLQQVMKAFDDHDLVKVAFPLLNEACNASASSSTTKLDEVDNEDVTSVPLDKVLDCVTACISVAYLLDILEERNNLMHILQTALSPGFSWTVKLSGLSSIKELYSKFRIFLRQANDSTSLPEMTSFVNESFHSLAPKIIQCLNSIKTAQFHVAGAECLLEMIDLYQAIPMEKKADAEFKDDISNLITAEKNELAKSLLKKCLDQLISLKSEILPASS